MYSILISIDATESYLYVLRHTVGTDYEILNIMMYGFLRLEATVSMWVGEGTDVDSDILAEVEYGITVIYDALREWHDGTTPDFDDLEDTLDGIQRAVERQQ